MPSFYKRKHLFRFFIALSFFIPMTAHARAIDEIKIKSLPDGYGYEININFLFTIQYQSHAPNTPAKKLYVQLKTIDFKTLTAQEADSLRERLTWGPDPTTNIPLQEITFEGGDPERPQMTFIFTEEVECAVHSSADLRSLIIKVKRKQPLAPVTEEKVPEKKVKAFEPPVKKEKTEWNVQNYGSFSQFYFRDQTIPEGGEVRVNRSDLSSDLDLNSRWKNDDMDINARFTGGHQQNFLKGKNDRDTISALSIAMRSKTKGLYGKLGRQSLATGGVFGRFDGGYTSFKLNPMLKLNGVFGYPVDTIRQTDIQTNRRFYGVNLDFGKFRQKWDFNTYFIEQQNSGLIDRRGIGAEVRYFDPKKTFFTLLDYDIFFKMLNIFLFNGHWTFLPKTTVNLVFDYRESPFLTLNNAIQGQGVDKLSDLFNRFSKDELKQLAKDRTADSKSVTFGITQDIKKDWQLVTEVSLLELGGTITSSGVEGQESTGWDSTYSVQLIGSNVFKENDVFISGISFSNTAQNNIYSLNLNGSFPLTEKTRVIPKLRVDYRDAKNGGDNRITTRPTLRIDYNFKKWMRFEVEGGLELVNEKTSGIKQKSTEAFISVGYRINF